MNEVEITAPGGPEVLRVRKAPLPLPGPDEVLVHVAAAGVNRPDVIQRQGNYPMPDGVTPVPGLEVAGNIVAIGDNATDWAIGDKVCGLTNGGGYAEYCLLPATQCLPVPTGVSMIEAAAIAETFFTVWANLFQMAKAKRGDRVLIHGGTSGIGTTALMLCAAFGIECFATAGSEDKCAAVAALGGQPINYRTDDFAAVILSQTRGRGVDIILDIMGASYFKSNLTALARDGRLVVIGFLGGAIADGVDLQAMALKRATITGSTMRARTAQEKARIAAELRAQVWPLLASGQCRPVIDQVFRLEDAPLAHARMERGDHIGKIVLQVTG
ncbi:NAD(P)H-quinone oxidoreductase [Raoultella terrigena]|uniref:NAD(P)H-quinone oxidoreductase n=1 Tax=Raoultella terrigena TaxID=577 RepID=UPI00384CF3FB